MKYVYQFLVCVLLIPIPGSLFARDIGIELRQTETDMVSLTNEIIDLAGRGSNFSRQFIVDQNEYLSEMYKFCQNNNECIIRGHRIHIEDMLRLKSELLEELRRTQYEEAQVSNSSESTKTEALSQDIGSGVVELVGDENVVAPASTDSTQGEYYMYSQSNSSSMPSQVAKGAGDLTSQRILKISFLASLVSFGLLLFAAFTNRIVIFYDWSDFGKTLMIFVSLVVASLLVVFFDGDLLMQIIFGSGALLFSLYFAYLTIRSSIVHNPNILIGIIVSIFKICFSFIMALLVLGKLSEIQKGLRGGSVNILALIFLGIFGYLTYLFVNGERVERKRMFSSRQSAS